MTQKTIAWQYTVTIKEENISKYEFFAEMMDATLTQTVEHFDTTGETEISVFFENNENLNKDILETELADLHGQFVKLEPVLEQNWEEQSLEYKPIQVGRFYISGNQGDILDDHFNIYIPVKMAFGTGEHATTYGCLSLYEGLVKQGYNFKNGLDMGCGSAILSMCASKADKIKFLGVEIDPLAADIAQENLAINDLTSTVKVILGDGFNDQEVKDNEKYDLIFANILKNPLIEMSQSLISSLSDGGIAILSGFEEVDQKDEIIQKYNKELGLEIVSEFNQGGWSAIAFKK